MGNMDRQTYTGNYRHFPYVPVAYAATAQHKFSANPNAPIEEKTVVPFGFQPMQTAEEKTDVSSDHSVRQHEVPEGDA